MPKTPAIKSKYLCPRTGLYFKIKRRSDWRLLQPTETTVSFEVSVANIFCSSEFLEAQMMWAKKHFNTFEFSIGDTLYRHNYNAFGLPNNTGNSIIEYARAEGSKWLQANEQLIQQLLPPRTYRIMRWDDWLRHAELSHLKMELVDLSKSQAGFKQALEQDIKNFLKRRDAGGLLSDQAKMQLLKDYLIEEIAVYWLQNIGRAVLHIYPGGMHHSLLWMARNRTAPPELYRRHFAHIAFSKEIPKHAHISTSD